MIQPYTEHDHAWWVSWRDVVWAEVWKVSLPPDFTKSSYNSVCGRQRIFYRNTDELFAVCTRMKYHTGRHAAGDGDYIVAVWSEPVTNNS